MAKKKSLDDQVKQVKNSFKKGEIKGMVFIVLDKNDEVLIGADGLDESTTHELLMRGAEIMNELASSTLH